MRGKATTQKNFADQKKDHPRLCGEKCCNPITIFFTLGSPPPMRGKVADLLAEVDNSRDHPRLCGEKAG